jgi:protein TonB
MNFSLGEPIAKPVHTRPGPAVGLGPAARGPISFGQFARVTDGRVDPSWLSALHEWWLQHGYYPEQAIANGDDGTVGIQIVVDRSGRVQRVELESRSGSVWLDMGAQAVFRDARLPVLPPDTPDPRITVDLTIRYRLIRR